MSSFFLDEYIENLLQCIYVLCYSNEKVIGRWDILPKEEVMVKRATLFCWIPVTLDDEIRFFARKYGKTKTAIIEEALFTWKNRQYELYGDKLNEGE
tara:strand:+ start:178 stop:468 length:291 start_codon:yes stop_codon:yes gene_type:complete